MNNKLTDQINSLLNDLDYLSLPDDTQVFNLLSASYDRLPYLSGEALSDALSFQLSLRARLPSPPSCTYHLTLLTAPPPHLTLRDFTNLLSLLLPSAQLPNLSHLLQIYRPHLHSDNLDTRVFTDFYFTHFPCMMPVTPLDITTFRGGLDFLLTLCTLKGR